MEGATLTIPAWRRLLPTRAIGLLMAIGFVDLLVTAVLHSAGLIVELNPVMRPFIEQSELLFAFVKGTTLVAAWGALVAYSKINLDFVRKASLVGSAAYCTLWVSWFLFGSP
ncbi:MAG: hypothetical protein KIT11_00580 [Fimbriimonadaceae bacterium]|nr:hypothetical protein [Fimbriimonadaceae bacterium]QYK55132.1 MAG: hypothetical protein KF733_08955 [Fimbriimonadaceae bacterium]